MALCKLTQSIPVHNSGLKFSLETHAKSSKFVEQTLDSKHFAACDSAHWQEVRTLKYNIREWIFCFAEANDYFELECWDSLQGRLFISLEIFSVTANWNVYRFESSLSDRLRVIILCVSFNIASVCTEWGWLDSFVEMDLLDLECLVLAGDSGEGLGADNKVL